jgi:hypothetical protein
MTRKQEMFYFSLVRAAIAAHCEANHLPPLSTKDASALRHRWHVEALGADKSHTEFSNADFDKAKAHLLAITKTDDFDAAMFEQGAADAGERKRLLFAINRHDAAYVNALCASPRFKVAYPEELTTEQLRQLATTLTNRARSHSRGLSRAGRSANLRNETSSVGRAAPSAPQEPES